MLSCCFKRLQCLAFVVAVFTIVSFLMIIFFFNYPTIARERVIDSVVFKNNSEAMDRFRSTKNLKNLRISFYLYNVTNAKKVIEEGAKINLREVGPFVYDQLKTKNFIDNNQTSGLITYKLNRAYFLNRNLSIADPKQILITWPNVPLLVARDYIDNLSFFEKLGAYQIINRAIDARKEPPFITDTVEKFLFDGSKRELFEDLQKMDKLKFIDPWPLKDNKFGLLYGRNNTENTTMDHIFAMSTGFGLNQTYRDLNQYKFLDGKPSLPFWKQQPPGCNVIDGTDGEFFSPFIQAEKLLEVYSVDLCRKIKFKFAKNTYINGVFASEYAFDERNLKSGRENPENQCYCLSKNVTDCQGDGLIDLSTCSQPNIFASCSHFFAGSPKLLLRVTGLSPPNASIHQPVIYVEPNTGFALKVRVPIQFNVKLEKGGFKIFNFFNDDENLIIPLLTAAETVEITEEQATLLKSELLLLDSWLVTMVLGGAIVFMLAIFVITTILCIKFRDSQDNDTETSPFVDQEFTPPSEGTDQTSNYRTI